MKTKLQIAGFLYAFFALVVAYQSVASPEALAARRARQGVHTDQAARPVSDNQRLDGLKGDGIGPYDPNNLPPKKPNTPADEPKGKAAYTVVVWTASWCGPCKTYKAKEVPALLKAGFKVQVLDIDKDNPPDNITSVPTVVLYYKGVEITTKSYWKAADLIKYVDNRMSLKMGTANGDQETVGNYKRAS